MIVTAFSVFFFNIKKSNEALNTFLNCESMGIIPGTACDKSDFGAAYYPTMILFDISWVIILLYPAVNLMYVIDVQEIRRRVCPLWFRSSSGAAVAQVLEDI